MKFGTFLFSECPDATQDHRVLQETLREARLSEELGMDALWLAEHHFDGHCVYVDPITFATALVTATKKIKVGFSVLQASLYHPVRLAEQLSLLDQLSEGRIIVGLGRGSMYNTYEYTGYQINPDEARERLDEAEEIMLKAWTGKPVDHAGKYWQVKFDQLRPSPYTKPHPPLMRAVSNEESLARQARLGRSFLISGMALDRMKQWVALAQKTMAESGHDDAHIAGAIDNSWTWQHVAVAETDREAMDIGLSAFREMIEARMGKSPNNTYAKRLASSGGSNVPDGVVCGSPATVAEKFRELAKTGIGSALCRFRIGLMPHEAAMNSLNLFMTKVVPALR